MFWPFQMVRTCPVTYGKLGQDVSAGSNSNANDALKPKSSVDSLNAAVVDLCRQHGAEEQL